MQNIAIIKAFCLPGGFAKLFSAWGGRKNYWVLVCLGGISTQTDITLILHYLSKNIECYKKMFHTEQHYTHCLTWTVKILVAYSEPYQTSTTEFFFKKNCYRLKQLSTKSRKCSILDVSQGSEYASAITFQTNKKKHNS